ncbi:helix-turn-helix domain-containing protein [Flavobacterium phragmitis]|uniref:DNA-binding transcriptional regulator, XRE-family HTH domain n=1 Tax=Flavobacterium phragmitis TaxID=739143 RepID=A0A1I1JZT1_9FLAO|nr:helix-turn-helix transcriptional regulator [Flavobacterium phragmitis]SFC53452.1 DNA-binding transcriptional regulator, XRE-family HTH domain [Flavobacterium phragmitis]
MTKTKLTNARLAKGISQEELADLIGMTQSNYSRRENGHKKISEVEWIRIAKELGVSKEEIYEPDEDPAPKSDALKMLQFTMPNFILEHIELLKKENKMLKEKLKQFKNQNINS